MVFSQIVIRVIQQERKNVFRLPRIVKQNNANLINRFYEEISPCPTKEKYVFYKTIILGEPINGWFYMFDY